MRHHLWYISYFELTNLLFNHLLLRFGRTAVVFFSRIKPVYPIFTTGPPTVPQLNALPLDVAQNGNANLSCEANQLNARQMASYKWKWMFKNGREITNVYGKYKILSTFSQPNSCQQTKGAVYLQVENLTREDLGTYMCALLESGTKIAVADVPFYEYGKLRVLNCIYLVRFDENYNFLIIRVTIPPRRTSHQVLLYHYHHQTPQATYIGCTHRNLSA